MSSVHNIKVWFVDRIIDKPKPGEMKNYENDKTRKEGRRRQKFTTILANKKRL